MERAAATPELLDGPLDDLDVLSGNLRDLRRVNWLLGGSALSRRAVDRLLGPMPGPKSSEGTHHRDTPGGSGPPGLETSLLDVGTGAADIALALRRPRPGRPALRVVAVDARPEVLEAARRIDPVVDRAPRLELSVADGRALPFEAGTFDIAHSSLVIHHLEPGEAVDFLAEMRRVSRRGVVVNDLLRGRGYWAAAWAGSRVLSRNRLTRHDAPLSVWRAYSLRELRDLIAAAGLRGSHLSLGPMGHRVAIAAVPVRA